MPMAGVRGQGRKFDVDTALDAAMSLFWRNGYEGTSIANLTTAMGIKTSSLYAAFKDKKNLFYLVVEHYLKTKGDFVGVAFDEEIHALPLIRRLLFEAAEKYTNRKSPGGCLIVSAAACVSDDNRDIEEAMQAHRLKNIKRLEEVLVADIETGVISSGLDAASIAEFVGTVLQGMAQRGREGASYITLKKTAEMAYGYVESTISANNVLAE